MSGTVNLERDGEIAFLVIDNPPINTGSRAVRKALLAAIETVEADSSICAAVLIGAGRSFIAGSDIKEFDLPLDPPQLPAVIDAIERSSKPYVAALHGAALGGGYELALGCDARIAMPATVVGLPETTLGIIPGAGGTQKLPRLVGISKAIALICSGRRVKAEEAFELGMIDAIAQDDLRAKSRKLALSIVGTKRRVIERLVPPESEQEIHDAEREALASARNRPHIAAAISHVKAAAQVPAAEGLANERATFEALRIGNEAKALRHIFFAEREAARGRLQRGASALAFTSFGVVGAGTMGAGIATAILQSGYPVVLVDSDEAALSRAQGRIHVALDKGVSSGKLSSQARTNAQQNLTLGFDLSVLAECDVIVEAIIEDLDAKRRVVAELGGLAKVDAILATNTSYLDIDQIAAACERPENVIGLHFFSPAHIMKLLEVVGCSASSDVALATGLAVAKALGKQAVEAGNSFGFIGNRIYAAYRASCEFMLEDGALPHEVDAAMEAFGFAMGPFAVADLSGLDIAWRMRQHQAPSRDPGGRYVRIPDTLCEAGRYGRKTGAGYYSYDDAGRAQRAPEVEDIVLAASRARNIERKALTSEEIQTRALAAIINEAGLVLEEAVALRSADIDVVLVNGYGFPRWTGGPLEWARRQDPEQLADSCAAFVTTAGASKRTADLSRLGIWASADAAAGQ